MRVIMNVGAASIADPTFELRRHCEGDEPVTKRLTGMIYQGGNACGILKSREIQMLKIHDP